MRHLARYHIKQIEQMELWRTKHVSEWQHESHENSDVIKQSLILF